MARRVCPWRHAYTFDNVLRRLFHDPRKILGPYLNEGSNVTDIGCGMGFFAIEMARIVGDEGCVIAVDVQQEMLDVLHRRAERKGVADRIRLHSCSADEIGVEEEVDFALAFWMVHETPDPRALASQVAACLNPGGKFLVVEPWFHVSHRGFREILGGVREAGLHECDQPRIRLSRAALFQKA